jgi:hypothetical protein
MFWWGPRHSRETVARVVAAYPSSLADDVRTVLRILPRAKYDLTPGDIGAIVIGGEPVAIPYRVHFPEPLPGAVGALSPRQRLILATLLTRHHDGHIRERYVTQVAARPEPWAVPFVVQLLGEYVVEIAEALEASHEAREGRYRDFANENPAFCRRTCSRMVNYWSLYYRRRFPVFREYATFRVAWDTGVWQGRVPRRRRRR